MSVLTSPVGIEFRGVCKRYGKDPSTPMAVKEVNFAVPAGSLTTILGPSGCGKTTTLRLIAGLESPSFGEILIHGRDVTALGPAERNVSMVFQSYALFPHMDVIDNVGYGLSVSGVGRTETRQRALAVMETVGLVGFEQRMSSELSGGQQQRVALARALVLEPAVLLFDEPLSNLDARLRRSMREEIRSLQQRLKLTVAYVTHDQGEALAVSDNIIVMDHGVIAQIGAPQDLYETPQSAFVAGFMGEAVLFDGSADAQGAVRLGPVTLLCPPGHVGRVKVAVRPEAWQVLAPGEGPLPARLAKRAYLGNAYEYTFDTELGAIFVLSADVENEHAVGAELSLTLAGHGVSVVSV